VPRSGEARGRFVIQTMATLFLLGLVCAGGLLLGTHALAARFSNPHLADLAWPLAFYGLFYLSASPVEIALTSAGRTGWAAICYVGSDLARIAALLAPIQSGLGLQGLAWFACGFALLRLVVGWSLALAGAYGPPALPTRASVGEQLRYSLPFAGAVLLSVANTQLPQYLVATLTDVATFAVFAVGALQLPLTDSVYTPVAEVMMVRLASARDEDAPRIFRSAVSRLVVFFLPIAALAWATAPELIVTLFTTQYQAAVPIFIIAIGELLLSSLPVDGLLRALAATRAIFVVNLARVALSAVAVPVGLTLFGLPGAMAGYLASQYLAKALLVRAAARRLGISFAELIPWRIVRAWALRAALMFAAIGSLRVFGPWHRWAFFLVAAPVALTLGVLASADVFVRPTRADGDALSVREALALGCRVVASDAARRPMGTVMFPVGDADALAEILVTTLAAPPPAPSAEDGLESLLQIYRRVEERTPCVESPVA